MRSYYLPILSLLFLTTPLFSTTYTSIANGNWNNSSVWSPSGIPGDGDNVVINGHTITHGSGTIYIDRINISNSSNVGISNLTIESSGKIIVQHDVQVESANFNFDTRIIVKNFGELEVGGDMKFERTSDNIQATRCQLLITNDAKVVITGNYVFYHRNGDEAKSELWMQNNASLTINKDFLFDRSGSGTGPLALDLRNNAQFNLLGNLEANLIGGSMIDFYLTGEPSFVVEGNMTFNNSGGTDKIIVIVGDEAGNGSISVEGNLKLNSTASNKFIELEASGVSSSITVGGDLELSAVSESTTRLTLSSSSVLNLAGAIQRPNNYGLLLMGTDATLNLNGSQPQSLAPNNVNGSGTDSLLYTNVTFNNTSGSPTSLSGPLVIEDHLAMNDGIIISTETNPVILTENATIGTGKNNAFIDGPIIKKGITGSDGIIFPTGDGSVYAPISVSKISNSDAEITVQYFSEPPPFGNDISKLSQGLKEISSQGYWNVERNVEADGLNITLYWTDADAQGIYDISDLVVAGLSGAKWKNYGQESSETTGGTGSGVGGSITSAFSEPPPFGVESLTFGATSSANKLPVELTKFIALEKERSVDLSWQTESEIDFSHFILERSADGSNFERLTSIMGSGNINTPSNYLYNDPSPFTGWNYYRLKMIDLDGTYEFSNIEVVSIDDEATLEIYPNPVKDVIQIKGMDWGSNEVLLQVFDKYGKLIYTDWIDFENGFYQVCLEQINVHESGTYFIRVATASKYQILKFIKTE